MIAVDTNVLVYAHREDSAFHEAASRCVGELAEGISPWVIPWPCIHEFLAVVTHPRRYAPPTTLEAALDQVDAWLESPGLVMVGETSHHWAVLRAAMQAGRIAGPAVHDARIAALCIQHGVSELLTADRDFGRFAGLATRNPLVG